RASGRDERGRERGEPWVVALRREARGVRRREARRIQDHEIEARVPSGGALEPADRVGREQLVLRSLEPGAPKVLHAAVEGRPRRVDAQRARGPPRGGRDREGARVREQVEDALRVGQLADLPAVLALIEEQPGLEAVAETDAEREARLADGELGGR